MATHSSIFAWEIPWTEEPGGLESTGSLQFWIIALLYSGEELIHIHMNNLHKPINLVAKVQIIIQFAA